MNHCGRLAAAWRAEHVGPRLEALNGEQASDMSTGAAYLALQNLPRMVPRGEGTTAVVQVDGVVWWCPPFTPTILAIRVYDSEREMTLATLLDATQKKTTCCEATSFIAACQR